VGARQVRVTARRGDVRTSLKASRRIGAYRFAFRAQLCAAHARASAVHREQRHRENAPVALAHKSS
jgi:hypothetical protein